jgi:hypothetical protein
MQYETGLKNIPRKSTRCTSIDDRVNIRDFTGDRVNILLFN